MKSDIVTPKQRWLLLSPEEEAVQEHVGLAGGGSRSHLGFCRKCFHVGSPHTAPVHLLNELIGSNPLELVQGDEERHEKTGFDVCSSDSRTGQVLGLARSLSGF